MDQSGTTNGAQQHNAQNAPGGIAGFYSTLQQYSEFTNATDDFNYDFMADDSLFQSNTESTPAFNEPPSVAASGWSQSTLHLPPASSLASHESLQPSFGRAQYPQPSFDPRHPNVQQSYNSQVVPRSPSPYQNPTFQPSMTYEGRDPTLLNPQYQQSSAMSHQRSPSIPASSFPPQRSPNPYYTQPSRQALHPAFQTSDYGHFTGFPEAFQRPQSHHFVDPSFLTAHGTSEMQQDRSNTATSQPPSRPNNNVQMPTHSSINSLHAQQQMQQRMSTIPMSFIQNNIPAPVDAAKAAPKPRKPKDPNALKRPVGRPRKDGSIPRVKSDVPGVDSPSDSDSEEQEIEEVAEPTPALLNNGPPTTPEGKAIFDAVTAVWSPRNKPSNPEKVRDGLALFSDTIRNLRDAWKAKNESFQQAELTNSPTAPNLKMAVARQRSILEAAIKQSLEYGHEAHIREFFACKVARICHTCRHVRLGRSPWTLSALQSLLNDRFMAGDYDGSLMTTILKLINKFKPIDQEMLEKTKTLKFLTKLVKKANKEAKPLAESILARAAAGTKNNVAKGPASPVSVDGAPRGSSPQVAGVKRLREGEGPNAPGMKRSAPAPASKPAVKASKPLALQAAERKRAEAAAAATAKKSSVYTNNGTSATSTTKPKTTSSVVQPKSATNSIFSTLMSASKKPGTSNAARAAVAKEKPATVPAKKEDSPSGAVGQAPTAKSGFSFMDAMADMNKPKEVKQEKTESRPPETEEEQAKRLRKEERRKLRVSWRPDADLVEVRMFTHDPEEEIGRTDSTMRDVKDVGGEGRMLKLHKGDEALEDEDDLQVEGEDLEDHNLTSEVDFSDIVPDERERNGIKLGGTMKAESPESEAQNHREENTLMVVYTLPSDQPESPKEPPPPGDEEYNPVTPFGDPNEITRTREAQYNAAEQARKGPVNGVPDLNAIIAQMKQSQPLQQQQQNGHASVGSMFPQAHLPQPQQQPAAGLDISKLLAVVNAQNQIQAPQAAYAPPQPAAGTQNLAALLAQVQQQQQNTSFNINGAGNPNPYPGADNDYNRKRDRYDDNDPGRRTKKGGFGERVGAAKPGDPNYKTVVCKFYLEGKCLKGDECTFRHDPA